MGEAELELDDVEETFQTQIILWFSNCSGESYQAHKPQV